MAHVFVGVVPSRWSPLPALIPSPRSISWVPLAWGTPVLREKVKEAAEECTQQAPAFEDHLREHSFIVKNLLPENTFLEDWDSRCKSFAQAVLKDASADPKLRPAKPMLAQWFGEVEARNTKVKPLLDAMTADLLDAWQKVTTAIDTLRDCFAPLGQVAVNAQKASAQPTSPEVEGTDGDVVSVPSLKAISGMAQDCMNPLKKLVEELRRPQIGPSTFNVVLPPRASSEEGKIAAFLRSGVMTVDYNLVTDSEGLDQSLGASIFSAAGNRLEPPHPPVYLYPSNAMEEFFQRRADLETYFVQDTRVKYSFLIAEVEELIWDIPTMACPQLLFIGTAV